MPETSLVIEDEEARQRQAELTRFQEALGLKKKHTADDLKKYKYGDELAALDAEKPTGFKCERDIILMSMELEVCRNDTGAITFIDVNFASFRAHVLASESPKDFVATVQNRSYTSHGQGVSKTALSETELGRIRYSIQGGLHPCIDEHNHFARGHQDHASHKQCFLNKNLIFIFSDKEATVRELRSLGYDVEKDFCTLDIYDLRELNAAYQARCDARTRGPTTRGQRTTIPQIGELSTRDEILKATKCFSSSVKAGTPALDVIKAAVKRATDDVITAGRVRTREQIDGGRFSQPRKVGCEHDAIKLLRELDLARMGPSSERILDLMLEHDLARFRELPSRIRVAIVANGAHRHGLTKWLAAFFTVYVHVEEQTAQTVKLVQIATAEARVRKMIPPATVYTYQAPVAITLDVDAAGPPTTTQSGRDKLRKDQPLPPNLVKLGLAYQKASRDISTRLVGFVESQFDCKSERVIAQTRALYSTEQHMEYGVTTKYPKMKTGGAFKSVASRARQSGWVMDDEVAGWFITAIQNRRELRNWYDRLPSNDPRVEDNEQHEAWLQTMIEVVVTLAGHRV